jgi:glycosyltransferase involved in cell wall biosynthesis/SAM-dependent methyltransferase
MRIAYFSPLPPCRSGIADYSEALLPELARHADIDVFIEDCEPAGRELRERVRVRHWREFEEEQARRPYDSILYHIGNNPLHVYIYDLAVRIPGVLMLHEFNLHYLLADVTIVRQDWDGYFRELEYNVGAGALERAAGVRRGEIEPDYSGVAMNRRLLENSRAAIVHSGYMARLIRDAGFSLPLAGIPHGVAAPPDEREAARARLGLDHQPTVGAFGFLKPYKRIRSAIQALSRLVPWFPDIQLLLVGEEHPHYPLRPLVRELGLDEHVRIPGFVGLNEFISSMSACDVCLNLRCPTVGESSGSLLREMALGRAVIVSDLGSYAELPDDACIKLPPGDIEVEWLVEYLRALLNDPGLREALGSRARQWAAEECSWAKVARQYAAFLKEQGAGGSPDCGFQTPPGSQSAIRNPQSEITREELASHILSYAAGGPEIEGYVRVHLNRLVRTIEITPPADPAGGSVLEMGCYMQITPALQRYLGYRQIRGCYYGAAGRSDFKTVFSSRGESFSCWVDLFDAEKHPYPYPDAAFDTVLCCELIEHLYHDPMHMMSEINRILKPGGYLVLTTPNIAGARALQALLHGYHPGLFHTYVVPKAGSEADPRHNREYAPRDVRALLESSGLEAVRLETGWLEPEDANRYAQVDRLLAQEGLSRDLRGDIIYAVGRKVGPLRERFPVELYTSF